MAERVCAAGVRRIRPVSRTLSRRIKVFRKEHADGDDEVEAGALDCSGSDRGSSSLQSAKARSTEAQHATSCASVRWVHISRVRWLYSSSQA
eukprot:2569616-Pleurochrysis_carterae.AAC.3